MAKSEMVRSSVMIEKASARILIVDDNRDLQDSLRDLFLMEGFCHIETASDIFSAKRKFNQFNPDIVLVDVGLGTSSGLDLVSFFKRESEDVECIVMTAHRNLEYAVEALRHGAAEYLLKPIDSDMLLSVMEDIVHRHYVSVKEFKQRKNIEAILDQSSGFIFLLSPTGSCMEVNHTALTYNDQVRDDVVGRPFWETPWWGHSGVVSEELRKAVEVASSGKLSRLEIEVADKNGQKSWFDFLLKPIFEKMAKFR